MSYSRIAVVTGANKGIGFGIVRHLALQYPASAFNNGPLLIYLTARDETRGEEALKSLLNDRLLKNASALKEHGGLSEIKFHSLDISQTNSIRQFRDFLEKNHPEGIDIVINNAGVAFEGFDSKVVKDTLECNYYGTLEATQDLLPLIRDGGRLVNVSSMAGKLNRLPSSIASRFLDAKTTGEVTALMESFKSAVADGTYKDQGWPTSAYSVSKAGVTGMTKTIASQLSKEGSKTLVNACCPGWVETDMTYGRGIKTIDHGAQTPVMLALGDIDGKTGLYWTDERPAEW